MEKIIVNLEQIIAGSLLKFGSVDKKDILLIIRDLSNNSNIYIDDTEKGNLDDYIESIDGRIALKEGIHLNSLTADENETIKKMLCDKEGDIVKDYFSKMDISEFTLRKMKEYNCIKLDEKEKKFSDTQLLALNELIDNGYLWITWNDAFIHDEYQQVSLTDKGELKLFQVNNKDKIKNFKKCLDSLGYDSSLLSSFFKKQNLNKDISMILDIDNFEKFCNDYDLALFKEGVQKINYHRLTDQVASISSYYSNELMQEILSINDDNKIIICYPNQVFRNIDTDFFGGLEHINWDDIDLAKMSEIENYKIFAQSDRAEAFKYINKCLWSTVQVANQKKLNRSNCLAVIEDVSSDVQKYDKNYLVRGIIRADKNGYSIALNPVYEKTLQGKAKEKVIHKN